MNDPLAPPDDLDLDAQALWRRTCEALKSQGVELLPIYKSSIDIYVRAVTLARQARREADGANPETAKVLGRIERRAEKDARKYAKSLTLTPAAQREVENTK
jgi:phage terminase small subunit